MLRANEKTKQVAVRTVGNAAVFNTLWNVRRLWHHLRQIVDKDIIITLLHVSVILHVLANVVWSTCTLSRSQTSSRVAKTIPKIKHNA